MSERCPAHGRTDCSPLLNGCSRLTTPHFTCPRCGAVSYNPNDIEHGYCGRCHDWTGDTNVRVIREVDLFAISLDMVRGPGGGQIVAVSKPCTVCGKSSLALVDEEAPVCQECAGA